MTWTSFITAAITFAFSSACFAEDRQPLVLSVPEVVQNEANRRSIDLIRFEGNETYSAQSIRIAFNRREEIHTHLWPAKPNDKEWTGTTWQEFTDAVKEQVLVGYGHAGFLDAAVSIKSSDDHPVVVVIEEGDVFNANKIVVEGANAEVAAGIREDLATQFSDSQSSVAGVFRIKRSGDSKSPVWQQGKPVSTLKSSRQQIQECVNATMYSLGYRFAESTIEFEADQQQHTVDLHITVNSKQQNPVSQITFSGLKAYSEADVRRIIDIEAGAPASPQLCRRIESALVNTGRFLFAECSTETPFGPEQPLSVHVRVAEYSDIAPDEPFTEVQQGVLNYADWLNNWPDGDQDVVIEAVFDVQKCQAALPNVASKWMEYVPDSLGAWLHTLDVRMVVSPKDGFILKVTAKAPNDDVLTDYSLVHARNTHGIFSHRHHRKFAAEGDFSAIGTRYVGFTICGNDPDLSDRRLNMKYNVGAKSNGNGPIESEIYIQPSALLCNLTSRFSSTGEPVTTPPAVVAINDDGREVIRSHGLFFALETDSQSGQLLSAKFDHDACHCVINVNPGQLQRDLAKLRQDSKDYENYFEVDNGVATAMRFLAAESEELPETAQPALMKLAVSLLKDSNTQRAMESWLDGLQETERFPLLAPDTSISIPIWLMPQDQLLRQVMQVVFVTKAEQSVAQLRTITINAMSREEFGPLSCALLAARFRKAGLSPFAKTLAVLGQRRLAASGLFAELEPALRPSTISGAIAHCVVKEVQKLDEEEFEALLAEAQQIKWKLGGKEIDISQATLRQVLTTLRIHRSPDSAIVLRDCLTLMCESKTEDLNKLLAGQQQPVQSGQSLFRAASSKKGDAKSKSKGKPMYQPAPKPAEDIDLKLQLNKRFGATKNSDK